METTLKVTGMNCGACVNHVTTTLQEIEGVQTAAVDLSSGRATVMHDEKASARTMVEAIEEAGYEAQELGNTGG